jgi:hypothetical protein
MVIGFLVPFMQRLSKGVTSTTPGI